MSPTPRLRASLIALVLVNMLPALELESSWGLSAIALVCAAASLALPSPAVRGKAAQRIVGAGVIGAILFLLFEMFWPREEPTIYIIDLSHFLVLLCCCKFLELTSWRDYSLVLLIAFLLLVISAFISASLLFGVALVCDLVFGALWLSIYQQRRQASATLERVRAIGQPTPTACPSSRPASRAGAHARAVMTCSLLMAMLGGAFFITVPRGWGVGLLTGLGRVVPAAITQFQDHVELQSTVVYEDSTPVMRCRFSRGGRALGEDEFVPYMRGATLDRYENRHWYRASPAQTLRSYLDQGGRVSLRVAALNDLDDGDVIVQEVWLDRPEGGHLFSLYPAVSLESDDLSLVREDPGDQTLRAAGLSDGAIRYEARSLAQPGARATEAFGQPPRSGGRFRQGSRIDSDVARLARTLCAGLGDPSDPEQREFLAGKIRDYLASGAFAYSLSRPRITSRVDPIRDFLFENRRGHCEFFASAMTLMCQAAGIPARLVTGYAGGTYDPATGQYRFERRDAHAWVEVFLPERGWTTFDPSPPAASRSDRGSLGLWASAMRMMNSLGLNWATRVVSFDAQNRTAFFERLERWLSQVAAPRPGASLGQTIQALLWGPDVLTLWQRVFYWLLLVLCVVFVLLVLRVMWILTLLLREYLPVEHRRKRRAIRRPAAKFYDRLLVLLANKGHVRPAHLTPMEHALRLANAHVDLRPVPEFVGWFYGIQYGDRSLEPGQRTRIKEYLERLRVEPNFALRGRGRN